MDADLDGRSGRAKRLARQAEEQEQLLITMADLERLQALLDESHAGLQQGFLDAWSTLQGDAGHPHDRDSSSSQAVAARHLESAMKGLQFHDLATQLLAHTSQRLRRASDRLAVDLFAHDDDDASQTSLDDAPPQRPNPVTQSAMDEGTITLF